ncbi:uncharacterized protein LOC112597836 [Melanaphis sacchari]|uniref:uncharacterized protein LOC112597836 n=1 Tax=Melanaphis sacchari TaxID=742174 RepID=UPI000DC14399|nr:uncharacterized protein LOC112597836 [Melanaphis sacchari]XP_025199848.1 uncharacterized protein LOC112597836 [Melanaphis sacchari]
MKPTSVYLILLIGFCVSRINYGQNLVEEEFIPSVTATCKAGYMTIKVTTNQPFVGAVHARDYRSPSCLSYGNGTKLTTLGINLLATQGSTDYCGIFINNKTEERSVPIAIRIHRTLELADDKYYVITCGKSGFKNSKNETSLVSLKFLENGKRIQEVVYSHPYTLRAEISRHDGAYGIRVKNCFAFNKRNNSVNLINELGCPSNSKVITPFKYDPKSGYADATLSSMFRFPDSPELYFQCDIEVCRGACVEPDCDGVSAVQLQQQQQQQIKYEFAVDSPAENGTLTASTTVFVLEPGETARSLTLCDDPADGGIRPPWLLYLCIAFGLMFLIMLVINVFLCSAMTCSCARTDIIEKEPSIIEDYDPYRSWHGSQYGSRYSLNGKPGYVSGGSTMNSTRSMSTNSDHYAIVHSRPGSRYSGTAKHHPHMRGPPSNIGSHYSGK